MNILVLNAGSSSLKFQVISTDLERIQRDADERLCRGYVERIGGEAIITIETRNGPRQKVTAPVRNISAALDYVLRWLASDQSGVSEIRSLSDVHAVGHRVVHGGEVFRESAVVTDEVLKGIEDCIALAPLHNPNNVKGILAVRQAFGPGMPQVAVFDTAFHTSLPAPSSSDPDSCGLDRPRRCPGPRSGTSIVGTAYPSRDGGTACCFWGRIHWSSDACKSSAFSQSHQTNGTC